MSENKKFVLYGGTYLNKGGAAIAYGTLQVLSDFDFIYDSIIDPESQFPTDFFVSNNLNPIFRYSDVLSSKSLKSINPIYLISPFTNCLVNSYKKNIRSLKGHPIWHIGDSPFSDYRTSYSIIGQVIALYSLQKVINGKVIIGGISLEYPRTKTGEFMLKHYFKTVDYFFIRGIQTYNHLLKLGVPPEKISMICDFAYHLNKVSSEKSDLLSNKIKQSDKPSIGLILRDFSKGTERQNYINNLIKLISKLEVKYSIFYVPTSYAYLIPENDLIFLENTLKVDSSKIVNIRDFRPEEIISIFSNFDVVVSTRLHGAVIGTLANVPTVHLYEGRKSLEVITDIFGENLVPLIKLSTFSGDNGPDELIKIIDFSASNKRSTADKMKLSIRAARERSIEELKTSIIKNQLLN